MKIVNLKASNIKNLKAIEITPEGNLVDLRGKNGAGKSAVLDAIFSALTGKRLDDAIRHGEEKAEVQVDMGEYTVRKRWTAKGEYMEVINKQGDKKVGPQTFLNNIIGKLSFDPLSFKNMKPKDQIELLKNVVGLDFSDLEAKREEAYTSRTGINALIKESEGSLKAIELPEEDLPKEKISLKDVMDRIKALRDRREAFKNDRKEAQERLEDIKTTETDIETSLSEIEHIKALIEEKRKIVVKIQNMIDEAPKVEEVSEEQIIAAEKEVENAQETNMAIMAVEKYDGIKKELEARTKEADKLTDTIMKVDKEKADRVAGAKMPIEGLSFGEKEVLYKDIPFSRRSTGEQIRISAAIAMKLNPGLKVVLIHEGSEIDAEGRKILCEMAKDEDYQVWMTSVDEGGDVGILIEDGEVKKIDGKDIENS